MTVQVQTVLGPIPLERLGRTLLHEHLYISFQGAESDPFAAPLDRPAFVAEAVRRLRALKEHGVSTFVDPCPIELGRDPALMAEVSEKAEINIVCTTGFYYEAMGLPPYWRPHGVEVIAELLIHEIEHGIGKTGIRPGAIKCASGAPQITALEEKFITAAAIAQKATGVPIITHTQDGVGGPEQQAIFGRMGVPAHRCLIGHCCGSPDPAYHRRVVEGGSYIGFDRIGMLHIVPDEVRAKNLAKLVQDGFRRQVVMSMDRFCGVRGRPTRPLTPEQQAKMERLKATGAWPPHHTYLFTDFIPALRRLGLADADIFPILDENPRRFFAGEAF
jgi:phosphotriesterase-related protein